MRLAVNGRNIEITPAIKAYVEEKIGKIVNHYDQIIDLEVTLSVIKNPSVAANHVAEVSCNISGARLHVEEIAESMYASIDLVADKLNRQVLKHKDKLVKGKHKNDSIRLNSTEAVEEEAVEAEIEE
jgi:putative sigma-54 modulation protein